jgi:hypothetical protein
MKISSCKARMKEPWTYLELVAMMVIGLLE